MIQKLLEELNAIDENIENVWLLLSSVTWVGNDLNLSFTIKNLSENAISSEWLVTCVDVISYNISDAYACGDDLIYHDDDHPAILQYIDPHVKLHFNGKAKSASQVVVDLWAAHLNRADDWIPFDAYVNNCNKLLDLITGGYGLLAEGPKFLIDEYETVLAKHSISSSRTEEVPYKRRIENKFEPVMRPIEMIHFGESFIIAKEFEAKRHKNTQHRSSADRKDHAPAETGRCMSEMMNESEVMRRVGPAYLALIGNPDDPILRPAICEILALEPEVDTELISSLIGKGISWRERLVGLVLAAHSDITLFIRPMMDSLRDPRPLSMSLTFAAMAVAVSEQPDLIPDDLDALDRSSCGGELGRLLDMFLLYIGHASQQPNGNSLSEDTGLKWWGIELIELIGDIQ